MGEWSTHPDAMPCPDGTPQRDWLFRHRFDYTQRSAWRAVGGITVEIHKRESLDLDTPPLLAAFMVNIRMGGTAAGDQWVLAPYEYIIERTILVTRCCSTAAARVASAQPASRTVSGWPTGRSSPMAR